MGAVTAFSSMAAAICPPRGQACIISSRAWWTGPCASTGERNRRCEPSLRTSAAAPFHRPLTGRGGLLAHCCSRKCTPSHGDAGLLVDVRSLRVWRSVLRCHNVARRHDACQRIGCRFGEPAFDRAERSRLRAAASDRTSVPGRRRLDELHRYLRCCRPRRRAGCGGICTPGTVLHFPELDHGPDRSWYLVREPG